MCHVLMPAHKALGKKSHQKCQFTHLSTSFDLSILQHRAAPVPREKEEKKRSKMNSFFFFFLAASKMTCIKLLFAIFRSDCAQFPADREQIRRTLLCASLHVDSSFYILTNYSKLTHFSVTFTRTMGAYSSSLSGQGKSLVSTLKQNW